MIATFRKRFTFKSPPFLWSSGFPSVSSHSLLSGSKYHNDSSEVIASTCGEMTFFQPNEPLDSTFVPQHASFISSDPLCDRMGALFIGILISAVLHGVTLMQAHNYFTCQAEISYRAIIGLLMLSQHTHRILCA